MPIVTIPIAVILVLHPDAGHGLTSNIMSLGGIAIAIGAMVDAAIVVVEQTHKKLEHWEAKGGHGDFDPRGHRRGEGSRRPELLLAARDRGLVHARSSPCSHQEGRSVQAARVHQKLLHGDRGVLAITLDPALRLLFMRTR